MEDGKLKVGIYARISTTDKGQDVDLQLRDIRTYAHSRGFEIYQEYVDKGHSGAEDKRPALGRLLEDARKRKIDAILVWRLDRFSRSLRHLIMTLAELKAINVFFISYQENLDFTTPTGQLMFHLLGAFAEFERQLIKERVRAGLANARAKGKKLGRPKKKIDMEKLLDLRRQGLGIKRIAKSIGLSVGLVHKTLSNQPLQTPLNTGG